MSLTKDARRLHCTGSPSVVPPLMLPLGVLLATFSDICRLGAFGGQGGDAFLWSNLRERHEVSKVTSPVSVTLPAIPFLPGSCPS